MRTFFLALLLAIPLPALAEVAKVKAADHSSFSRVVFYGQSPDQWAIHKVIDGYMLHQSGAAFDVEDVFQRMSKTRVSDLVTMDDGVFLRVACDCHANAFFLAPDMVVIDINDGPGEELGLSQSKLTESQRAGLRAALSRRAVPTQSVDPTPLDEEAELAEAISIAEALLLEQLGRAASQGLATPRDETFGDPIDSISPLSPRDPVVESDVLSAATAIDIEDIDALGAGDEAPTCFAEDAFPTKTWSRSGSFTPGLSQLRSELSDSMDTISDTKMLALARHYIAHGFTVEAAQLVAEMQSTDAQRVRALARLIDGEFADLDWRETPNDCEGTVAVWRILSAPGTPISETLGKDALRVFPSLPPDLARIITPRLIEIAQRHENKALAKDFAAQLRYLLGPDAWAPKEITSLYDASSGRQDDALLNRARSSELKSPEALVEYVTQQFNTQQPLPSDIPDLIAAYAFERKGTELGRKLRRSNIMASALTGDFATVFASMETSIVDPELRDGAFALLVKNGSDTQFLRHSLVYILDVDPAVRLKIADRLVDLGFDAQAARWIPNEMSADARLLRAKLFVSEGRLDEALRELAGQETSSAKALRAHIQLKQRNYRAAALSFAETDAQAPALRTALLSKEPELIASHWSPSHVDALTSPVPEPQEDRVSLAHDRQLVGFAKRKRAALAEMLNSFPKP